VFDTRLREDVMRHAHLAPAALAGLLALAPLVPAPAGAITLTWLSAVTGFTDDVTKWTPSQLPQAADILYFDLPGTYTVQFRNTPVSTWLAVDDGTVTMVTGAHATSSFFVGTRAGAAAVATLSGGAGTGTHALSVSGNVLLGTGAGVTGTLNVTNVNMSVTLTGAGSLLEVGRSGGSATMKVLTGATVTNDGLTLVPSTTGASGTLTISGKGEAHPSTFVAAPNAAAFRVGDAAGTTGTVTVENGGRLESSQALHVGTASGGTGSLVVGPTLGADTAHVALTGDLWLAHNGDATAAGTGTLTVDAGSTMDVTGGTWTYDDQGGAGTITLEEGARFTTHDAHVGAPAAELLLHGGRFQVSGGALDLTGDPLRINSGTGSPIVELLAGATCAINSPTVPALEVGGSAAGRLNVLGGSSLTVHDRAAWVGSSAGGDGTLEVGGGTLVTDLDLVVGRDGHGLLLVDGGGHATLGGLNVSSRASGSGFVTLTDAGSDAHVSGQLVLSGTLPAGSGAASSLITTAGAKLWLDNASNPGKLWPGGVLSCTAGGEVHLAGPLADLGTVSVFDGVVTGGTLVLTGGGRLSGRGDVQSRVLDADTLGVVSATGSPLLLGAAAQPSGYQMAGRLDVAANDVTLRASQSASLGSTLISGGTLRLAAPAASIAAGRYLKGFGTVQGPLTNGGSIFADGSGLAFGGTLLGTGQATQGSLFRFLAGGGFAGGGAIKASVQADSGSVITATADLALGAAPAATTLALNGALLAGNHAVTLAGTLPADVGGQVTLDSGTLAYSGGTVHLLAPGGRVQGTGTVSATLLASGRIDPGVTTPSPAAGILTITSLQIEPAGSVRIDLGDHALAQGDVVNVTGTATLGGTLDVALLPGYAAAAGDSFLVMLCGTRVGTFANVTIAGLPTTGMIAVHYNGNQVWVVILSGTLDVPRPSDAPPDGLRLAAGDSPGRAPAFVLELPAPGEVRLEAFDVTGRRIATLHDGALPAGRHRFALAPGLAPAGMLFARARVAGPVGARTVTARALVNR
jgi:hypothetical protein